MILRKIISLMLRYSHSKKFADFLLWPVSKRLFGQGYTEIVSILPGLRMKVYGDMEDMVNKLILFTSDYMPLSWEPGTARFVQKMATNSKCSVVAGSHIGYYPLILSFTNSKCKVYAFEPNPLNKERCKENVNLNKFSNITIIESALGDTIGQSKMYFDHGQSSLIDTSRVHNGEGFVDIVTLESFFKDKNDVPDIIILDAEGFEPYILKGGKNMIKKTLPMIIFELNNSALRSAKLSLEDVTDQLLSYGYFLFIINDGSHGVCYDRNFIINLIPFDKASVVKMPFVNICATVDLEKIKEYIR